MENPDGFKLNSEGYFQNGGVDIMAFDDVYPEGHQSGVSVIMHGNRVAANGDIRFEQTPGQWQPVPKQSGRVCDRDGGTITASLSFPDRSRHLNGFNPMIYPDFEFGYTVTVKACGSSVVITADLEKPVPESFAGKLYFNLELFPGALFGKPWIMDGLCGIFPPQPNGPMLEKASNIYLTGDFALGGAKADINHLTGNKGGNGYSPMAADDIIACPYACGKRFTLCPDDPYNRITVETLADNTRLELYDGRLNHNNGWFVISGEIPAGVTKGAAVWKVTPNSVRDWMYTPVVQVSQVGYHTRQTKTAIIELDKRDTKREDIALYKITENGEKRVLTSSAQEWGDFLRYSYLKFDFTGIREEGLYKVRCGSCQSSVFKISRDVYERGVWQPVLEYFLPVQMCHMRVNEKYRVWHDLCHDDDARMAPLNHNHFDGYAQGGSTLTKYNPGDCVPRLNAGGWHDAGDFDLRIESQTGEIYMLAMAYEAFGVYYDATSIDQTSRITEIHQSDGKNDVLQQIEHGALSVLGSYEALGRFYRGIICGDLRQYVLLGDASAMTDGIRGTSDDRWVFTEDNPAREFTAAAHMAAASRALKGFNDDLSAKALQAAREVYDITKASDGTAKSAKIHAAVELFLTLGEDAYKDFLLSETEFIVKEIGKVGWFTARAERTMKNSAFTEAFCGALPDLKKQFDKDSAETPYGIPYRPHIWGAGWIVQKTGFQYYFLRNAYPGIFGTEIILNALNFVLGCHPGSNTMSFVSGVGTKSATVGYGLNRADWSYIPGGVISGTALIRPDFPELLVFPYLWQQTEYMVGGTASNFMFLVLAAREILNGR